MEPTLKIQATDSTDISKYLNVAICDDMLRANLPEYQKVKSLYAKNVGSEIEKFKVISINIETQLKNDKILLLSYRLKIKPTAVSCTIDRIFLQYFTREAKFYHELLPIFEEIYREAGVKLQFAPSCYKLGKNLNASALLLEDMTSKGYRSLNSIDGLNMLHTLEVLKKLAALHAASAVVFDKRYREFSTFTQPAMDSDSYAEYEKHAIPYTRKFVENLRLLDLREYQDLIKVYLQNYSKTLCQTEKVDSNEFNVLNHGDCRSQNVLFKYDAFGNILDTIFVDFQKAKYGSPAQDLLYFIISSTQLEDKLRNFDHFIKYYHDHLINNLKVLRYPRKLPKLTDLHLAILNHSCWAFTAILKILPFVLQDTKDAISMDLSKMMDTKLGESNIFDLMFRNQRYAEQVQKILPWLENRAFLEI